MKKLLATLVVFASVCGLASADDKSKPDDKTKTGDAKLSGTYTIVSGEENGKAVPKDHIDGSIVVFTETSVIGTDKAKKEFFSATYTVDTSKTPWHIHMTNAGPADKKDTDGKKGTGDNKKDTEKSSEGLIKVDGDTVTVIYALPGGKAPTEFKTADKQNMFVLKRKADKDK